MPDDATSFPEVGKRTASIGGWLFLACLFLSMQVILGVISIVSLLSEPIGILICFAFTTFASLTLVAFIFQKSATRWMFPVFQMVFGFSGASGAFIASDYTLSVAFLFSAIAWTLYFIVSKRVAVTFTK